MIKRHLEDQIRGKVFSGKAIILTGPRQTGKTILIKAIFQGQTDVLWLNGDDPETRLLLEEVSTSTAAYPSNETAFIHRENYFDFLS